MAVIATNKLTTIGRQVAIKLILLELLVLFVVTSLFIFQFGIYLGISVAIGGSIFILSHSIFSWLVFLFAGAQAARKVAVLFYLGEVLKILTTIVLFYVAYNYIGVHIMALVTTYFLFLMANAFLPVMITSSTKNTMA